MVLPLWGQLQKSLEDNETIEQAIERKIREHNDEPEAHLGEGRSLEEHKKAEVLDHPAFSVVTDKETIADFEMVLTASDDTSEFAWGDMNYRGAGIYESYLEPPYNTEGGMTWEIDYNPLRGTEEKNFLVSLSLSYEASAPYFEILVTRGEASMMLENDDLYVSVWGVTGGFEPVLYNVTNGASFASLILTWYFDAFKQTYFFYVNGEEVKTVKLNRPPSIGGDAPSFNVFSEDIDDGHFYFSNFMIKQEA